MPDRVGQQFGNYRLVSLLGRGGCADTYLAEQVYLHTFAAIKLLQTQLFQEDVERFYQEARTIANLKHPHIVRVLDFGLSGNTPYLVMDYAPNGTLRQLYRRRAVLPLPMFVPFVKQVASALQYAHNQRVIHRDVKPENMLLDSEDEVLLSDFGIAVVQGMQTQGKVDVAGTVTYMAPEQLAGRPVPASDQYALGVVVYEWLCGVPPFRGNQIEVAIQHEQAPPRSLRELVSGLHIEVEQVVMTALAKKPEQRFASIQDFASALEQASYTTATDATAISPISRSDEEQFIPTEITPLHLPQNTPRNYVSYQSTGEQARRGNSSQMASNKSAPVTPDLQRPSAPQQSYQAAQLLQGGQAPYAVQRGAPVQSPPPAPAVPAPVAQRYAPPTPPPITILPQARSSSTREILALAAVIVLLFVGSVFGLFFAVYMPNQREANATATEQAKASMTAQATATASALAKATAQAQGTATAAQTLYTQSTSGKPVLNDSLQVPTGSSWDTAMFGDPLIGGCSFAGGAYHSTASPPNFIHCLAAATLYRNFTYQVEISIVKGHSGGLIIHADKYGSGYYFGIGTDGSYLLEKRVTVGPGKVTHLLLASGRSAAINQGNNQFNQLTIISKGDTMYIYINKQYVDTAGDATYPAGSIGVYSEGDVDGGEIVARNAQVWQ